MVLGNQLQRFLDSGIVCQISLPATPPSRPGGQGRCSLFEDCSATPHPPPKVGCIPITLRVSGLAILNYTHRHGFWPMSLQPPDYPGYPGIWDLSNGGEYLPLPCSIRLRRIPFPLTSMGTPLHTYNLRPACGRQVRNNGFH